MKEATPVNASYIIDIAREGPCGAYEIHAILYMTLKAMHEADDGKVLILLLLSLVDRSPESNLTSA